MRRKALSLFTMVLAIVCYVLWENLESTRIIHEKTITKMYVDKADFVFDDYMNRKNIEASNLSNTIKFKIIDTFDDNYPTNKDKEILKQDLLDVIADKDTVSPAMLLIKDIIEGVTLNNVKGDAKDNNDLIIFGKDRIIGDLSLNCAGEKRTRNLKEEQAKHTAKRLEAQAFNDIVLRGKEFTFWHFLPVREGLPWRQEVIDMATTNIKDLKDMYIKYEANDEFLEGFEFLVTHRIYDTQDYFGEGVISVNGTRNYNHLQITVVSGYNILDQLKLNPTDSEKLREMDRVIDLENERFDRVESKTYLEILFMGALFILLFFATQPFTSASKIREEEDKEDNK